MKSHASLTGHLLSSLRVTEGPLDRAQGPTPGGPLLLLTLLSVCNPLALQSGTCRLQAEHSTAEPAWHHYMFLLPRMLVPQKPCVQPLKWFPGQEHTKQVSLEENEL